MTTMTDPTLAIATVGLTKDYGGGRGILDLHLTINPGEVVGFLGPNGAGKSTTIRLLMGLIRPTSGTARIFGHDCWREAVAAKRWVGYVPGEQADWGGLRGAEIVASIAGLRGGVDQRRVADLCQRLDLDLGRRWREYSHGNRQKVLLVIAFMSQPRLLILDEPTTGLDPLIQQVFYALVREARAADAAVLLSSHVLSEVEQVCDRVGIVRAGRLVALAGMADLHGLRSSHIEIEFAGPPPVEAVCAVAGISEVAIAGQRLTCTLQGPFAPLQQALIGHPVVALTSREPSLEEQFLRFYGPAAGDGRSESGR
jgi:ABC-2 type transport system ATP-binding protein